MRWASLVLLALSAVEGLPLAAVAAQESPDRVAAASRELESNDPKRVFAAVQALSQLGGASLPLIEARAKDAKGRVRDYLELAAEEIRSAPHLPGYPAVKRITMKSTDKNVVDLLVDLRARTGAKFSLDNLMGEEKLPEIPFEVKDATMLEALDAICHAGNVTVSMSNGQFMLQTGEFVDQPRFFYGHYSVRLSDFDIVKTVTFRKPAIQGFNIEMNMIWDPAAAPLRIKQFRVAEAADDRGKSLLPPPPDPKDKKDDPPPHEEEEERGPGGTLYLVPPSPAATKVAVLRGFVTIVLPKSKTTVLLPVPAVDQVVVAGDFQVTVASIDPDEHEIVLRVTSKKHAPEALAKLDLMAGVTLRDWDSTSAYIGGQDSDETGMVVEVHYEPLRLKDGLLPPAENAPPPVIDKIEISLVTAVQEKRVPFEFRDLKLK